MTTNGKFRLLRKNGRTVVRFDREEREVPVRIAWARPLTGWGRDIVLVDDKKREVAMIEGLESLDTASRRVAEEAIGERYLVSTIHRVRATRTHFGARFWDVETDRGRRTFAVRDPSRSVLYLDGDGMLVRDTLGNSYTIPSLTGLDRRSRELIENVV